MNHLPSGKRTSILRALTVRAGVPLALCGLLLTGCSGDDEPAQEQEQGQTGQQGGSVDEGDDAPDEGGAADSGDEDVEMGDVSVGTKLPDGLPDDLPLPDRAPTSVVTVGSGGDQVGGGWSLNYDGVSKAEVEQMVQQAEAAGYKVGGPFGSDSSERWTLSNGTHSVLVLFSDDANLSLTVTKMS
ncbi:hypothetical protein [Nocardioides sp. AE5]|uniref:hypothetical protein n=1 Tax=Nocardioides sp. AE5 TaxID=2962573 RepID=UPI0028817A15|nr:hypothetical protein [Nocardioides sp. AE5]MDT0201711.1 hypothetical protein [Nocardioides sp. AE5]